MADRSHRGPVPVSHALAPQWGRGFRAWLPSVTCDGRPARAHCHSCPAQGHASALPGLPSALCFHVGKPSCQPGRCPSLSSGRRHQEEAPTPPAGPPCSPPITLCLPVHARGCPRPWESGTPHWDVIVTPQALPGPPPHTVPCPVSREVRDTVAVLGMHP